MRKGRLFIVRGIKGGFGYGWVARRVGYSHASTRTLKVIRLRQLVLKCLKKPLDIYNEWLAVTHCEIFL